MKQRGRSRLLKTAKICIDRTTIFTYCNNNFDMPDKTVITATNDDWTMLYTNVAIMAYACQLNVVHVRQLNVVRVGQLNVVHGGQLNFVHVG